MLCNQQCRSASESSARSGRTREHEYNVERALGPLRAPRKRQQGLELCRVCTAATWCALSQRSAAVLHGLTPPPPPQRCRARG